MSIVVVGVGKAPCNSWSELSVGSGVVGLRRWRGGEETPGARIGPAGQRG